MMRRLFVIMLLGTFIVGCESRPEDSVQSQLEVSAKKTVRGVLKHFPDNVRSAETWYGHNFTINGIPIIATDIVPEDVLKKFVGSLVIVTGIWNPGKRWVPTEEESQGVMPVDPSKEIVIKGDGIMATLIGLVER